MRQERCGQYGVPIVYQKKKRKKEKKKKRKKEKKVKKNPTT